MSILKSVERAWSEMRERQIAAHPDRFTWVGGIPFTRFEMFTWRFTGRSPEGGRHIIVYNLRNRLPRRSVLRLAAHHIGQRSCQRCREVEL